MIEALPNQPIAFDASRLRGCCSIDPTECLLVGANDTITFQVKASRCAEDLQVISDPGFDSGDDWDLDGWTIVSGQACYERSLFGMSSDGGTMTETGYTATPGQLYEVHIVIASSTARTGVSVYFGGVLLGTITSIGEHIFFVEALTTASLLFVSALNPGESICLEAALVFERSTDFTLEFVQGETVVESIAYVDDIMDVDFFQDRITVSLDLDDIDLPVGCYTVQFTDGCDNVTLTSQCLHIADHDCTVVIAACANDEVMGFKNGFRPEIRVVAELKRPSFEYEFGEERLSDGKLNRYYAERTRTMELRITRLGEFGHNFISSLALWDHVYIGQDEYVVTSDAYEPGYQDVYSAHGAILLNVTPYQENARKIRCGEDNAGCSPPPNYWVQGTGPNEDYILQEQTNERILIN